MFGFETNSITKRFSWFRSLGKPEASNWAWSIIIVVNFILLTAVSAFCIIIFIQIQSGNFASSQQGSKTTEIITLDRKKLNQSVSNLRKRRATFDLLRDRQPDIPEPTR